jgi:peroxiredoxin
VICLIVFSFGHPKQNFLVPPLLVGLGMRSRRYVLLAEDGVVKVLNLEEGGAFTFSGAEDILKAL